MEGPVLLRKFKRFAALFLDFENEYNAMSNASHTMFTVELRKEEFKSLWNKVKTSYEKFSIDSDFSEEQEKEASDLFKQCREAYITCAAAMGELSQTFLNSSVLTSTAHSVNQTPHQVEDIRTNDHRLRLPPCTTEIFKGDYLSWPSFRDMFTAVYIDCRSITAVERLFYLRQNTQGEALEIVKKSPLTHEGFEMAWNNLKDRYENKRILVNTQLKILFNLTPVRSETAHDIKKLQRDINNCMTSLNLYGIDIDSWDPIFVFLCSSRLPVTTLSLWEQTVREKTEVSRWADLDNFLTARFQSLETVFDLTHSGVHEQVGKLDNSTVTHRRVKTYQAGTNKVVCFICSQEHYLKYCNKFLKMSPEERFGIVKKNNLCLNCFSNNHRVYQCSSKLSCAKCQSRHNTLLHREARVALSTDVKETEPNDPILISEVSTVDQEVQNCFARSQRQVLLGTTLVNIKVNGIMYIARALLDPGSQASFISEKLQRRLGLPTTTISARISGLNNALAGLTQKQCTFELASTYRDHSGIQMCGLVLPKLTGKLPSSSISIPNSFSLGDLQLADPNFSKSNQIDILIGADFYPDILLDGVQRNVLGSLVAQNTIFGWVLSGPLDSECSSFTTVVSFCNEICMNLQLEKFWKLEELPKVSAVTAEEEYCEELFKRTTTRSLDGRFVVSLPFKPQHLEGKGLGLSKTKAFRQFLRNEASLVRNMELKAKYDTVLAEYESLGHMIRVGPLTEKCTGYYLPHHAVVKPERTSTKLRVVFNASYPTSSGLSLNDTLYPGPVLQNDLMLLIIRWRFYRYVFNGDIEKMYRQILLHDEFTRFQRIVFRRDPNMDIQDFELKTVTFGVNCAPFLAIRSLLQLASDVECELPFASKILRHMMYADDALAGAHELEVAIEARNQLIAALSSAGFTMRKWTANDDRILKDLPQEHLLSEHFLEIDDESKTKTLGIRWNAKSDTFYFSIRPIHLKDDYTKREVLSIIASLFDPAGWLGPVIIVAKILMQQIWADKTGWDEYLTAHSKQRWLQFINDYEALNHIKVERWIGFDPSTHVEIHGFSDASERAYGACVYVRIRSNNGIVRTHLLFAKSRVAPLKTVSLPRLELCGALLLAELIGTLRTELSLNSNHTKFYCWSDSMIVLAWLQKPPCSWTTFISNRVSKIVDLVGVDCWRHVRSEHNPADIISRGVQPKDLIDNSLWWHGPSWLSDGGNDWEIESQREFSTEEERRSIKIFFTYIKNFEDVLVRFSSYSKALRVMAYVYRFISLLRRKFDSAADAKISFNELQVVKRKLIIITQKVYFPEEYLNLTNGQPINSSSSLLNLHPFVDEDGLIRVGGRLANAVFLSFSERHPIILPYNCKLSHLLVCFIHQVTLHGGIQLMLRVLRAEFWIPRSRTLIKSVIGRCKTCTIHAKRSREQIMSALPVDRTILERPFTRVGVDFAGPYDIKNYTGRACLITKGYVSIFVCFATRAIHLEAVSDLSTPTFLAAFARFVSRRGSPKDMYSDNGTNFVGASRVLKSDFRNFIRNISSEVMETYVNNGIHWHFNPAGAPHMGGLWEAGVKSFKHHFRRIASNLKYTYEEFSTLLARIEACLNSRTLCPLSEDVSCIDALTPGHFLVGGPLLAPPEPQINEAPISIINRWQRVKALNQNICIRWKEEYLKEMFKRSKWKTEKLNLKVNDMVVVRDDNLAPNEWRLGRITKVFPGVDEKVRVAEIQTARGLLNHGKSKEISSRKSPSKFLAMSYSERMRIVSIYRHCAGCLAHDHTWRTCKSEGRCKKCGDMHHTLLHKPGPSSSARVVKSVVKRLGPRSSQPKTGSGPRSSISPSTSGPRSSNLSSVAGPSSSTEGNKIAKGSALNSRKRTRSPDRSRRNKHASQQVIPYKSRNVVKGGFQERRWGPSTTYTIQETIMIRPTAMVKIVSGNRCVNERVLIDPGSECALRLHGCYGIGSPVEMYAEVRKKFAVLTPRQSVDMNIVDEYPGLQLADPTFYSSGYCKGAGMLTFVSQCPEKLPPSVKVPVLKLHE
ncbi:uncharacterized protein LOC142235393 [Haematobia irritans]|uniref:uncharacterized protein LOC142235393 n=1 Tax=Haematobia irritans TaxID=7368 RepID=UPI003F502C37